MATIPHLPLSPDRTRVDLDGVRVRRWSNMANGDVGEPIILTRFNDRTVQVGGTFGVGGSVTFTGSNDGVQWDTIRDVFNVAISATSNKLITLTEVPVYIRPEVTGDGDTSITCTVAAVGRG